MAVALLRVRSATIALQTATYFLQPGHITSKILNQQGLLRQSRLTTACCLQLLKLLPEIVARCLQPCAVASYVLNLGFHRCPVLRVHLPLGTERRSGQVRGSGSLAL